ncbi:MAG: cupredoxin domain-containing protein [Dehalococcoidia bacterium]
MFKFLLLFFALAVVPLCLACGDDDDNSDSGNTVDASLKDFQISLNKSSVSSGEITFKIKNNGPSQHEFVVDRTDLKADNLPYDEADATVKEDSPDLTNIDEQEEITPGDTESLKVNLEPGHYVIFCNIPAHYQQGMRIDFTVK